MQEIFSDRDDTSTNDFEVERLQDVAQIDQHGALLATSDAYHYSPLSPLQRPKLQHTHLKIHK